MEKYVDIDQVFKDLNPSAYKVIPPFVRNYIKKIIHEDRINEFMAKNKDLHGKDFVHAAVEELNPNVTYIGLDNIPEKGGAIVVSNHPLGGPDGLILLDGITDRRPDARFLVNDILMNIKNMGDLFVPVKKMGTKQRDHSSVIEDTFRSDHIVIVFPAGLVSRRKKGVIRDLEWRKGFVTRAVKYKKNIIPTFMGGNLTSRFYNIANARTSLGIGTNIEFLYLPDEMFKQQGKDLDVIFGKEVSYEVIDYSKYPAETWAQIFKDFVYTLKDNPEADFEEFVAQNPYEN